MLALREMQTTRAEVPAGLGFIATLVEAAKEVDTDLRLPTKTSRQKMANWIKPNRRVNKYRSMF